ncbi:MAG TPA: hypothetical protein VGD98_21940 [Ktedonobacteraceae bacterium]
MSLRYSTSDVVSQASIEQFLQVLAMAFQQPSNLYLTGDAVLVHLGLRSSTSTTLNLVMETSDEEKMTQAIRRSSERVNLSTAFTSPEDVIPIPWTWQEHAPYVGPYGYIDVFYFDYISLALSKIALGSEQDLNDVWLLVRQKLLSLNNLDNAYLEIQPRMGRKPYDHVQPQQFAQRYAQVRKWLMRNT